MKETIIAKSLYGTEARELAEDLKMHDSDTKEMPAKLTLKCRDVEGRTVIDMEVEVELVPASQ
jgi:hypothetical protein